MKKDPEVFLVHILESIELIQEYFDIDLILTWKVVKVELPIIKKGLIDILSSE